MAAPFLNANPVELILQGEDQQINITLFDDQEEPEPIDATALHLKVLDMSNRKIYEEDFFTLPPVPARIIKPAGTTGKYYMDWGDPGAAVNVPTQTETSRVRDLMFVWRGIGATGTEPIVIGQVVKIIDPRALALLPYMRLQVDKAVKIVQEEADIFLGFTDAQLLMYLEGGCNIINVYQPNTSMVMENFPPTHRQLLIDCATIMALQSQGIYAIDTDLPNYSDQGYSFQINHFPQIMQFMAALQARIDRLVPLFKLNFATLGSIHVEAGASFRLTQLLQASPQGILFRGVFSPG